MSVGNDDDCSSSVILLTFSAKELKEPLRKRNCNCHDYLEGPLQLGSQELRGEGD